MARQAGRSESLLIAKAIKRECSTDKNGKRVFHADSFSQARVQLGMRDMRGSTFEAAARALPRVGGEFRLAADGGIVLSV